MTNGFVLTLPKTLTLTLSLNWYKVKVSKVFSHIYKSIFVQGQINHDNSMILEISKV